jgi:hypothetical protein
MKRDPSSRRKALRSLGECEVISRNANFVAQLDSFQYRFSRHIKKVTASRDDNVKTKPKASGLKSAAPKKIQEGFFAQNRRSE